MRSVLACFVLVAACGARSGTPPPPPRTGSGSQAVVAPPPNANGPSEAECDELLTHAIAVSIADRQPPPSAADQAALRSELRPGFLTDCRAGTRTYHQCGMAAKSRADLEACKR